MVEEDIYMTKKPHRYSMKFEEVERHYIDSGCVLLTREYMNRKSEMKFICKCGEIETKTFGAFKRSPYCTKCYKRDFSKKKSFSLEKVSKDFSDRGCTLLSDEYINAWQVLDYICECGEPNEIQYANFIKGVRCKGCYSKRKYTPEKVRTIVNETGCEYVSQDGISFKSRVKFKCLCGEQGEKLIECFIDNSKCNVCAMKESGLKKKGEKAYNWNPDISDEDRIIGRDYAEYERWRKDVFQRDSHTCLACNEKGGYLIAHHKDGYHWCEERRLDVSNGVTLCSQCHNIENEGSFHNIYGNKNNTEEQFNEWLNKYQSEILSERRLNMSE